MSSTLLHTLDFVLPAELEAREPPEMRGAGRDDVRLMVSRVAGDVIQHTHFATLPDVLAAGDVLVVNTSATINAAFKAVRGTNDSREDIELHLSTPLRHRVWAVELRHVTERGSVPLLDAEAGERLLLPADASATLIAPLYAAYGEGVRLWQAELSVPGDILTYSDAYGFPIRYSYVPRAWPLSFYQTVFAIEPGSAEMPSAGRPFTWPMIRRLTRRGVRIAPLVLHTGVASLEAGEEPYPERYRVPHTTAVAVNQARAAGKRIVAVGTTAVRALETVASIDGTVRAGQGWTDLVVTPERGLYAVDVLLTGLHAPRASHLAMLEAFAGGDHLERAYAEAIERRYSWHEFGDLHLIMPD